MSAGAPLPERPCPLETYLEVVAGAWTPRILWCLLQGHPYRFADFQRALPGISPKVLTRKLRDLERHHLVRRTAYPGAVPHVEYALTQRAAVLAPVFAAMEDAAETLFGPSPAGDGGA